MSEIAAWEERGNRHLDLAAAPLPKAHHRVLAALALEFGGERARVLDLGCGLGQLSALLQAARPDWELHAADAYEACLDRTAARVRLAGRYRLDEQRFELARLPRDFELVVMSHVLEHMLDPVGALRETLAHVRPGGHLLLAVPNPVRPSVILASLLRRDYVNRGHVVAWDRAHWMNFLERILGLEVVRYASDAVPVFPERWKRGLGAFGKLERWLAGPLPWLSFSHIAVVRRPPAAPSAP
jgi:2-polyprenyl-3-methyl-5-hydroxy-6-metoxy-1,4-benzoquinol methylase